MKVKNIIVVILAKLVILLIFIYLFFRVKILLANNLSIGLRIFSASIFLVEIYFLTHTFGYMVNTIRAYKYYPFFINSLQRVKLRKQPKVAVFIPVYNEPQSVVSGTIAAAKKINYKNKELFILDDSDKPKNIEEINELVKKYKIGLLRRPNRIGFKAGNLNNAISKIKCKYFAVFDSDQQAQPNFLSELIPILEADNKLAFIQTPQRTRRTNNYIEKSAAADQGVFYGNICEGKSIIGAQFCCGSNVIYRRDALLSIKRKENGRTIYIEEWCVTEDFATSVLLHEKGWKSLYDTKTYAQGLAPNTLRAYNTQRGRWAVGTFSVFKKNFLRILLGKMPFRLKWEYFLSGSYYLNGLANFLMMLNVIFLIMFNIPVFYTLPFIVFCTNISTFYYSVYVRRKKLCDLFYEQTLCFFSFPLYIKSLLIALLGRKISFNVTAKNKLGTIKDSSILLQQIIFFICLAVILFGISSFIFKKNIYLLLNLFWLVYQSFLLGFSIISLKKLSFPQLSNDKLSILRRISTLVLLFKLK